MNLHHPNVNGRARSIVLLVKPEKYDGIQVDECSKIFFRCIIVAVKVEQTSNTIFT
jgi:hypothetical protein